MIRARNFARRDTFTRADMRFLRRTLLVLVAVLAAAAPAAAEPQTLHLHFQRIATGVDGHCGNGVLTSGPYMLASLAKPGTSACASGFLLIDDRTGRRTLLRPGGLTTALAFGAPWILFDHNRQFELYDIVSRRWRPLGCGGACQPQNTIGYVLGSRWLEFVVESSQLCSDGIHHGCGPSTYAYYNLRTHKVRRGLAQPRTRIVDLNSPTLVRKLCAPLRVPSNGTLTMEGRFAIASDQSGSFLERCGSHLHIPLGRETLAGGRLGANARSVLWAVLVPPGEWTGRIDGIWLPSLRRFTAKVPSRISQFGAIAALDAERLYFWEPHGALWAATLSP